MPGPSRALSFTALLGLAWAMTAAYLLADRWPEMSLRLFDADDAMRLVEVRDFIAGRGWFDLHEPRLNPLFGEVDWSDGTISADALSVPVSDEAVSMVDISAVSAERVAELPASQRCGPEPQGEDRARRAG